MKCKCGETLLKGQNRCYNKCAGTVDRCFVSHCILGRDGGAFCCKTHCFQWHKYIDNHQTGNKNTQQKWDDWIATYE